MSQTAEILKAMVVLCKEGTFNCNVEGAEKVAAVIKAARQEIERLEAAEETDDE